MGNSKAYISYVLLFAFFLSSHVLAHELQKTLSEKQKLGGFYPPIDPDWDDYEILPQSWEDIGKIYPRPTDNNKIGKPGKHYHRPNNEVVGEAGKNFHRLDNAELETKNYWTSPRASLKTMLEKNLKVNELKNDEDSTLMRHHNMVRPSEFDWMDFHSEFQGKTFGMKNGGKPLDGGAQKNE